MLSTAVAVLFTGTGGPSADAAPAAHDTVGHSFARAGAEFDVPRDLLVAIGYGESRLDPHGGKPSHANGYGVMHLVSNPRAHTLERAAALTGIAPAVLRHDTAANIRGAAAVLRSYADRLGLDAEDRDDAGAWYQAVAQYSGSADDSTARLYADSVYGFLANGVRASAAPGETVTVRPQAVRPERGRYSDVPALDEGGSAAAGTLSTDYPPALWVPANSGNYTVGRTAAISAVVIHVTQGSYAGSISWFQDPSSNVSAHYVIRSSDGQVTQTVRDKDTGYHARSGNAYSVGIEHEGYVDNPAWFTDAMYRSSAALTRHLADRYGIPKDRAHIVGHSEVPNNDHTDPGPNWNWAYYMQLVGGSTGGTVNLDFPAYDTLRSGSTGPQTTAAQTLLNAQGFAAGSADGVFGANTVTAVKAFQSARGLPSDGVIGRQSWTALLSAGTKPVLREGSSGADVKRLQRSLTAALGRAVGVDGSFGSGTAQAVRDFQGSRSLTVDGIAGSATWAALQAGR
ncbi:N-acetyl-anhydromuramyl-L-alanine amidase AmpD [Streptomyces fulvorobeus]|uniref:N-acetylmuramoyl-L-alanine amidase n=1 Tax=Streptomyces fulvorobeus TaxID=284028 RepID=A0A7Y9KZE7_9ACTN|nr:peptidoglycan-binding protein [Streptomyces fulvorobeus]NYE44425.1 N-acetyl-anhydromuramyl-L-alanine amidase AmpD [Streptomyces fulvorobeus]